MITDRFGREQGSIENYFVSVQRGDIPGMSVQTVRGSNPDIDTGSFEDMIPWGGLYVWRSAAAAMTIVSTAAADTAPAGIGARTVFVSGLDNAFLPISEIVSLAGLTPVALANLYRRINFSVVNTVGTELKNVGTISVSAGAVIQAQILPNESLDKSGVFTVPADKDCYFAFFDVSSQVGTDTCPVSIGTRDLSLPDKPFIMGGDMAVRGTGSSIGTVYGNFARFAGPRDWLMRAFAAGANNQAVVGRLTLLLEDK